MTRSGLDGMTARIRAFARAAWLRATDRPIVLSRPPIFIVGCGHSGTTVLCALLARHPDLNVLAFESNAFTNGRSVRHVRRVLGEADDPAAGRLVEKTPSHVLSIGRIFRLFKEARVIGVVRDGRDVAASLRARSGKFEKSVQRWIDASIALARWRDDSRLHMVRYEDLVTDPEATLNGMLDFLGLAPEARALLDAPDPSFDWRGGRPDQNPTLDQEGNAHLSRRREQLSRGLYDGRGAWRDQLSADEAVLAVRRMRDHLELWGYDATDVAVSQRNTPKEHLE